MQSEIPDWALQGPVSVKNFDYRNLHFIRVRGLKDGIPTIAKHGKGYAAWHEYFAKHLRGFPWAFKALMNGRIKEMNVPAEAPETFDPSFFPAQNYRIQDDRDDYSDEHRDRMAARFNVLVDDLMHGRLSLDSGEKERALPGTVFDNYDEAVRRHGVPRSRK